jgi:hypothetical protein
MWIQFISSNSCLLKPAVCAEPTPHGFRQLRRADYEWGFALDRSLHMISFTAKKGERELEGLPPTADPYTEREEMPSAALRIHSCSLYQGTSLLPLA